MSNFTPLFPKTIPKKMGDHTILSFFSFSFLAAGRQRLQDSGCEDSG
jgi:hypothetical protein